MNNSILILSYSLIHFFIIFSILITLTTFTNHPMNLMMLLISFTIMSSLMINASKSLYSFMLFLMIIGGMMIMFLYFSSLINNEKSNNNNMMMYFLLILFLNSYFLFNKNMLVIYVNKTLFPKIYFYPLNYITILMIMFLLFCLINIIKMCKKTNLPLRKIM